uniref:TF_AP-2 domain-containing protein n=1 Tax=Heterorhabditis bacteriophora TaxID=37862 RepID=A0A1I7XFX4_HETBA
MFALSESPTVAKQYPKTSTPLDISSVVNEHDFVDRTGNYPSPVSHYSKSSSYEITYGQESLATYDNSSSLDINSEKTCFRNSSSSKVCISLKDKTYNISSPGFGPVSINIEKKDVDRSKSVKSTMKGQNISNIKYISNMNKGSMPKKIQCQFIKEGRSKIRHGKLERNQSLKDIIRKLGVMGISQGRQLDAAIDIARIMDAYKKDDVIWLTEKLREETMKTAAVCTSRHPYIFPDDEGGIYSLSFVIKLIFKFINKQNYFSYTFIPESPFSSWASSMCSPAVLSALEMVRRNFSLLEYFLL